MEGEAGFELVDAAGLVTQVVPGLCGPHWAASAPGGWPRTGEVGG